MTVDSEVLALAGLVAYWKLTDRAGTNAPNSAPGHSDMPLTITNPTAGVALTTGGGLSLRGDGTSVRAYTVNLPAAHVLRHAGNTSFTYGGWVSARTLAGTRSLFGRNNASNIRYSSAGSATMYSPAGIWGSIAPLTINEPTFVAMTWDGKEALLYLNGIMECAVPGAASTSDSSDPWEVLSLGGNVAGGAIADIERIFVATRAVGAGELRDIYLAGAITPYLATGAASLADGQDTRAIVMASPAAGRCFSCGGTMRGNEQSILIGVNKRHVSCYGGRVRSVSVTVPTVPPTASTWANVELSGAVGRTMFDNLWLRASRATSSTTGRSSRFDGTTWTHPAGTGFSETAGAAAGAAALHWMTGSNRDSWLSRLAKATCEQFIASQQTYHPPGSGSHAGAYGTGTDGPVTALGWSYVMEAYLWLGNVMTEAQKAQWRASFVLAGQYWIRTERGYYVNGNIEAAELLNLWLLYRVTGDNAWLVHYEDQLIRMATPPAGMGNTDGDNAGMGWVQTVTGAAADGSGSRGYFTESLNTPGNHPGWDGLYTHIQMGHLARLYLWNEDPRVLKYVNALVGYMRPLTNLSLTDNITSPQGNTVGPLLADHTGSSRHPGDGVGPGAGNWVWWWLSENPQLRTADPFVYPQKSLWAASETEYRTNRGVHGGYLRNLGEGLTPLLLVSGSWPTRPVP